MRSTSPSFAVVLLDRISSDIKPLLKGLTINRTNYILIEFPHSHIPLNAKDAVFKMVVNGYRPIISHPERNLSVVKNPGILAGLLDEELLGVVGEFDNQRASQKGP